ncbi:alpha/beta hydrolase family protein [Nocardioides sp. Root151]|uniref:alpha/beta hydrolase family protein n=1 Tax=Nocardioides sp. Root151 TaxID=1736475 RepID=UPI000ABE4163|nr:alpha/beta fold hydrolase [Nocardioides sp. Root151]
MSVAPAQGSRTTSAGWLASVLCAGLLTACSDTSGSKDSDDSADDGPTSSSSTSPVPEPGAAPTIPARPPHPVSLPALMQKSYDGRALTLGAEGASTSAYTQHTVSYLSGTMKVSGLMNVPTGKGPFPALVLAHGYIDPAYYDNGQGMRREQDYLARAGYVTLHVDYRGHAFSDPAPRAEESLRLGYTEDVINAVLALRRWRGPVDDDRIGLVGRSMGGGVIYNALTVQPGLVDAAVVFAPVSSDTVDNFERWTRPERGDVATRILARYGEPRTHRRFWRNVSPRTFFGRVTEPLMIHHGTSDDSCPLPWSRRTVRALQAYGKRVTFHVYPGEEHAFGPQWTLSMERTVRFLRRTLS